MTDKDLMRKRLAFIEECLHQLATVVDASVVETNIRDRRFVEHTLQIAIQAMIDIASHVVSDEKLGEPKTNAAMFGKLVNAGWLESELLPSLQKMAGFRNVLVHGYVDVDPAIVRTVLEERLADIQAFVGAIRTRVDLE